MMDTESSSVYALVTNLCEKILDEELIRCSHRSLSKVVWRKKLRSIAYSILLKPTGEECSPSPQECFVKAIVSAFKKGVHHESGSSDKFEKCVDHLWQKCSTNSYMPSVIYFLAKMANEGQLNDSIHQVTCNENYSDILGFPVGSQPKKYHMYDPSSFILPDLQNTVTRETKMNFFSINHHVENQSPVLSLPEFQFKQVYMKNNHNGKGQGIRSFQPFPFLNQNLNEETVFHLEDEGYVSSRATPVGPAPDEKGSSSWLEQIEELDINSNEKPRHLTWECLGEATHATEPPPLMESGIEALDCILKIQNYLLHTLAPGISLPVPNAIHWKSLVKHVNYLLMGIETESFRYNESCNTFELVPGTCVEGITSETLTAFVADYVTMGNCYRHLSDYVEGTESTYVWKSIVQQAIRKSLRKYLHMYDGACLLVMTSIRQRPSFAFILMRQKLKSLQKQIFGLAQAFGVLGGGAPIPKGIHALGHLHRHATAAQRKDVACMLRSILHSACLAYFNLLERWVYGGEVVAADFFVVLKWEYISCRSRRFWTRTFSFNESAVPEFLYGLEQFLLRCGKSVHFLKICDPKNPVLEEFPSLSGSINHEFSSNKDNDMVFTKPGKQGKTSIDGLQDLPVTENTTDDFLPNDQIISSQFEEQEPSEIFKEKVTKDKNICLVKSEPKNVPEKREESHVKTVMQNNTNEEEMLEFERQNLIKHYGKLSEDSKRKLLRAEWRIRRMQLRVTESFPYVPKNEDKDTEVEYIDVKTKSPGLRTSEKVEVDTSIDVASILSVQKTTEISNTNQSEVKVQAVKDFVDECNLTLPEINELGKVLEDSAEVQVLAMKDLEGNDVFNATSSESKGIQMMLEEGAVREFDDVNEIGDQSVLECCPVISSKPVKDSEKGAFPQILATPNRTSLKKPDNLFPFYGEDLNTNRSKKTTEDEPPSDWPYRSVLVSLMAHSKKLDSALLQWMLVEKGLISHLRSLRAYFFLLDGEFGRRLSEGLFSAMRRASGGKPSVESLNVLALSGLLSHALASSTFATSDPNASLLSMTLRKFHSQSSEMDPLACVQMLYEAPWPLNVVLTEEALSKYSSVLDLLLRLKHASWALEDAFLQLRVLDPEKGNAKVFPRGWRTPHKAVQNSPQYLKLQLYRHQMMQIVRAVQSYITAGVLQASGTKLEEAITNSTCLDDFYAEHVSYVKSILFGCLLNRRSEPIANILNDILRLVMKFHWALCSRSWFIPPEEANKGSCHFEHPNFNVLYKIFKAFEGLTAFLLKFAWRLASHGYQVHLFELVQAINLNKFYNLNTGEDEAG